MSYQKQDFSNGEVLTAAQLNHMENGIADVDSAANATKTFVDKIIDPTLSVSGKAADAAKVGEAVNAESERAKGVESRIKEDVINNTNALFDGTVKLIPKFEENGAISSSTGLDNNNLASKTNWIRTNKKYDYSKAKVLYADIADDLQVYVFKYAVDGSYGGSEKFNKQYIIDNSYPLLRLSIYNSAGYNLSDAQRIIIYSYTAYKKEPIIITLAKDGSGDFKQLRSVVDKINLDNIKKEYIIYIKSGHYNLNEEYTQEEWNDGEFRGLFIPDNTSIIGIGNVDNIIISANDTEKRTLVSTLNISNNVTIKNITVKATNLRYTIHDDYAESAVGGYAQKFIGCKFYGTSPEHGRVFGSGLKSGANWYFENCQFIATTADCVPIGIHNNINYTEQAYVEFKNCEFVSNQKYSMYLESLNSNGIFTNVTINGCGFDGKGTDPTIRLRETNFNGCMFAITAYGNDKFLVSNETAEENPKIRIH